MSNRTFTMIKPDAMKNGHAGAILDKIIKGGFRIVALKQTKLTIPDLSQLKPISGGRTGQHSEYLQPLLDEMSEVIKIDPTTEW